MVSRVNMRQIMRAVDNGTMVGTVRVTREGGDR